MKYSFFDFINTSFSFAKLEYARACNVNGFESMSYTDNKDILNKVEQSVFRFISNEFDPYLPSITFDFNGHEIDSVTKGNIEELKKKMGENFEYSFYSEIIKAISFDMIFSIVKDKVFFIDYKIPESIESTEFRMFFKTERACSKCGETFTIYLDLFDLTLKTHTYFNKEQIVPVCPVDEAKDYSFNLKTPSKKIVFSNHFNNILDKNRYKPSSSICSFLSDWNHVMKYANDNIGQISVGNTSPSVFTNSDNSRLTVGRDEDLRSVIEECMDTVFSELEDDDIEFIEDYINGNKLTEQAWEKLKQNYSGIRLINSVTTGAWVVSFMDYGQFLAILKGRGLTEDEYAKESKFFVADISSDEIKVTTMNVLGNNDETGYFKIESI